MERVIFAFPFPPGRGEERRRSGVKEMELTLSDNALKTFARCITCLARIGNELSIQASPSQVTSTIDFRVLEANSQLLLIFHSFFCTLSILHDLHINPSLSNLDSSTSMQFPLTPCNVVCFSRYCGMFFEIHRGSN